MSSRFPSPSAGTSDLAQGLREGTLDAAVYFEGLCDRIEREDREIEALVPGTFDRTRVLATVRSLMEAFPDPASRPLLFGVPVGVKDIIRVDGFPTRCGSRLPVELFEGEEATCVTALKAAGCIVIAKTITTEFACFQPGPTRNPHDRSRTPGGSSSGSAAGVASGFFPVALGTQTAASITRPASYCGVYGFKPTYERVPRGGVFPFSPSADHVGVLSRDLAGIELMMPVLAATWTPAPAPRSFARLVLAVPEGPYLDQASAGARSHFEETLDALARVGCQLRRVRTLEDIETINEDHRALIAAELAEVHAGFITRYGNLYGPKTREVIDRGRAVPRETLRRIRDRQAERRRVLCRRMEIESIDFWVSPSTTDHAPPGLESTGDPVMSLPWTFTGVPTLSVPSGRDRDGLPQGLHLAGRAGTDEAMLADLGPLSALVEAIER